MRVLWALLVPGVMTPRAPIRQSDSRPCLTTRLSTHRNTNEQAVTPILSPEVPQIAFFWQTADDTSRQIPSCGGFQVMTTPNPSAGFNATLPLFFTAAAVGYEPYTVQVDQEVGEWFTWSAVFPLGAKITLAMTDSANHSGGAVDGYSVIPGYNNCTLRDDTSDAEPAAITFDTYPDDRPCDEIDLRVHDASPPGPYTVSLMSGSGMYANWTGVEGKEIRLKNVVPPGQNYHFFITNENGDASAVSPGRTSQLNIAGCNSADPPSSGSSTPIGAIVGGVIGGLAAAVLIALLAWWLVRRRNKKREEEYHRHGQGVVTSEFRTADGRAPLVEPFNVPVGLAPGAGLAAAGGAVGREAYDDSPTSGDGSYDKSLHYPSPSPIEGPYLHSAPPHVPPPIHPNYPHHLPSAASTLTPLTPYDPYLGPSDPHSPSSPATAVGVPAGYGSYESARSGGSSLAAHGSYDPHSSIAPSPTEPHPSSLAVNPPLQHQHQHQHQHLAPQTTAPPPGEGADGLANPEEFTYRLFDPQQQQTPGGGSWPPGARPY